MGYVARRNEEIMNVRLRELGLITFLMAATFILSMRWFPRTTPDSVYYLMMVDIFRGDLPLISATPPFCYRVLTPLIVALFPTDAVLTWASISVIANVLIVPVVYLMIRGFDIGLAGAFTGTGLTTVGIMSISLGSWVGTDPMAFLFLALAFLGIARGSGNLSITCLFAIGTLFKEVVILGVGVWMLSSIIKRDKDGVVYSLVTGIYCVLMYLLVRAWWGSHGVSGRWQWLWNNFWNFTTRPEGVIETFWLGFMFWIPVLVLAVIVGYKTRTPQFRDTVVWLTACIPLLVYLFMGLFTAYFSLRFIWPFYLAMAPLAGIFGDWFLPKFYEGVGLVVTGLAVLASMIFLIPMMMLGIAEEQKERAVTCMAYRLGEMKDG